MTTDNGNKEYEGDDELKLFYDYVYWPKEWFDAIVSYCRDIGKTPLELIEEHKSCETKLLLNQ